MDIDDKEMHNAYILSLVPHLDEDGCWSGGVSMALSVSNKNTIHEEDNEQIAYLMSLVASSLPVLEVDEYVRNRLINYLVENSPTDMGEGSDDVSVDKELPDNIVQLRRDLH